MKITIQFFLLLITSNLFGQKFPLAIELTKDSDTAFWYNYYLKDIERLNLIEPGSDTNFLRVSSSKYLLELSPTSNRIFFYVKEIWDNVQTGELFIKSYELTPRQVNEIENLYRELDIQQIPSDKLIKNWQHGFDGITYIIERKDGRLYSFKNYWTPSSQYKFDESRRILTFTNAIDEIVDYSSKRKDFEKEIPFYGWTYNNSMITIKVISNTKAYRKYKRKKKKQLRNGK